MSSGIEKSREELVLENDRFRKELLYVRQQFVTAIGRIDAVLSGEEGDSMVTEVGSGVVEEVLEAVVEEVSEPVLQQLGEVDDDHPLMRQELNWFNRESCDDEIVHRSVINGRGILDESDQFKSEVPGIVFVARAVGLGDNGETFDPVAKEYVKNDMILEVSLAGGVDLTTVDYYWANLCFDNFPPLRELYSTRRVGGRFGIYIFETVKPVRFRLPFKLFQYLLIDGLGNNRMRKNPLTLLNPNLLREEDRGSVSFYPNGVVRDGVDGVVVPKLGDPLDVNFDRICDSGVKDSGHKTLAVETYDIHPIRYQLIDTFEWGPEGKYQVKKILGKKVLSDGSEVDDVICEIRVLPGAPSFESDISPGDDGDEINEERNAFGVQPMVGNYNYNMCHVRIEFHMAEGAVVDKSRLPGNLSRIFYFGKSSKGVVQSCDKFAYFKIELVSFLNSVEKRGLSPLVFDVDRFLPEDGKGMVELCSRDEFVENLEQTQV